MNVLPDIECDGNIGSLLKIEDGPFRVEVIGCEECDLGVFVFITEAGVESSVTVDRDQAPADAARQAVEIYTGMREAIRR